MKRYYLACIGFVVLTGCSIIKKDYPQNFVVRSHDQDYLQARSLPPLKIPAGTNNILLGDQHVIPGYNHQAPTQPVSLLPPGSVVAQSQVKK